MDTLKDRRIVLVGGAGFIGHNLAIKLKSLGAEVIIVDALTVNNYHYFKNNRDSISNADLYLKIIQGRLDIMKEQDISIIGQDAREYVELTHVISEKMNADTLIHLAAVAHAGKSNKDPYSTFDHSLRTLENCLDIARSPELNIKHFIYFSSSMVYGNFLSGSVTEETPCEPVGIYGALKFAGEKLVIAYNQVFNLPYTIVRPSALYGERCVSRRVGQIFIENAMQGLDVSISGDGTDRLDFTYIEDLTGGIVKVLIHENAKNQIFNITYGQSRSIKEMADILKDHFPNIVIKYLPRDVLMPVRGTLSIDKAKEMIGYDPQYPLEKGLINYINWYKELFNEHSVLGQR